MEALANQNSQSRGSVVSASVRAGLQVVSLRIRLYLWRLSLGGDLEEVFAHRLCPLLICWAQILERYAGVTGMGLGHRGHGLGSKVWHSIHKLEAVLIGSMFGPKCVGGKAVV